METEVLKGVFSQVRYLLRAGREVSASPPGMARGAYKSPPINTTQELALCAKGNRKSDHYFFALNIYI